MMQTINYPVLIEGNPAIGFTVTLRDIPELITQADSIYDCMEMLQDAFDTVREIYAEAQRELPEPSDTTLNESVVEFML